MKHGTCPRAALRRSDSAGSDRCVVSTNCTVIGLRCFVSRALVAGSGFRHGNVQEVDGKRRKWSCARAARLGGSGTLAQAEAEAESESEADCEPVALLEMGADRIDEGSRPGFGLLLRTPWRLDASVDFDGVPQQSPVVDRAVEDGRQVAPADFGRRVLDPGEQRCLERAQS